MPLKEAAEYLHLDESTLRRGLCGTERFAKIYQGRLVFFVRSQVIAHKRNMIQSALAQQEKLSEQAFH